LGERFAIDERNCHNRGVSRLNNALISRQQIGKTSPQNMFSNGKSGTTSFETKKTRKKNAQDAEEVMEIFGMLLVEVPGKFRVVAMRYFCG